MTSKNYISLGKITALTSFIFGSIIIVLFYFTYNFNFALIGYGFVIIAGIFNLIVVISVIRKANNDSDNRKKLLKTSGIILFNIPIAIFYFWFVIILFGTMRITFTNMTKHQLSEIHILGCETEYIPRLKPNESKTVWVGITGDCSININYIENGEKRNEIVEGYVTPGMGRKTNYDIANQQ